MADPQYSLAEVAKITGKSEKTISRWIKSGKLPAIRHGTGYLISEDDIPLKLDPSLDRHVFIQQRLLEPNKDELTPVSNQSSGAVDINKLVDMATLIAGGQDRKDSFENISQMLQKHHTDVEKIIREQNELAEKYARATYKIGQLEERNRLLEENTMKLEQKMALLPPPEQWNSTRQELEAARGNLKQNEAEYQQKIRETERSYEDKLKAMEEELRRAKAGQEQLEKEKDNLFQERDHLQEELQSERKKGFWQKLFGT